jgi:molybdate transport system ATP-binding protein
MVLAVKIDHRLGEFHLRVEFECAGRLTSLFGPSGSGKTTIINAIAGLLQPNHARIVIDEEVLTDTAAGTAIPTHRRHIGYVFQEARLFPHMNVRQNLLYAQRFGGRRGSAGASFEAVADMLGLERLLSRAPSGLSGGERQRVAIGRALLSHPRLLLMDEPLASLDEARKQEILPYIERLRDEANVPIVYVSHSADEVRRLADLVVLLDRGAVVDVGPPSKMLRPHAGSGEDANINMLQALDTQILPDGRIAVATHAGTLYAPRGGQRPVRIGIRTGDVSIALSDPGPLSNLNVLYGEVRAIEAGDAGMRRIRLEVGDATIIAAAPAAFCAENLSVGSRVFLIVIEVLLF